MKIRFIGDIHGKFNHYLELVKGSEYSVQVGDFGMGFETEEHPIPYLTGNHYFVRGNHDDLVKCKLHDKWLSDGCYHDGLFAVGGAYSVDAKNRTEGHDWWENEQLTIPEINAIIDRYEVLKPSVVVSHDCPRSYLPKFPRSKMDSRTSQALDAMIEVHRPKLWVFGHYHNDFDQVIDGTRFVCVNKMTFKDINVGEYL